MSARRLAICGAVVIALSAQSPAPSPAPGTVVAIPLKAARHLEYAFTVSYYGSGEQHNSGMMDATGGTGSGVDSTFGSGGRRGTMTADVVAFTQDGGLVVQIHEVEESAPRPSQTFSCLVYGNGRMNCAHLAGSSNNLADVEGPTDAELTLLGFLGRDLLDPAKMDPKNHWGYTNETGGASVAADFTMSDPGDGKPVTIVETKRFTPHNQAGGRAVVEVHVTYDRALSVPDEVHSERHDSWNDSQMQTTIDMTLTKDSFATH